MPKLVVNATELQGTDVNFVSLVKRGANRIPFRITKGDNEMAFDLYKLGRSLFKAEQPAQPSVIAALVRKSADADAIKTRLVEAGVFKSAEDAVVKTENGMTVIAKADADLSECAVLKLDEDVGLLVKGVDLKKGFQGYDFTSTEFGQVLANESFFPSVFMGMDALYDTVSNIMAAADSPASAATNVNKACDDFKQFMTGLTSGLPVQAFKFDQLQKAAKKKGGKDGDGNDKESNAEDAAEGMSKAQKSTNGTGDGAEEGKGTGTNPKATTDDKTNIEAAQKLEAAKAALAKAQADLEALTKTGTNMGDTEPKGEGADGSGAGADATSDSNRAYTTDDGKGTDKQRVKPASGPSGGGVVNIFKGGKDAAVGKENEKLKPGDTKSGAGAASETQKSDGIDAILAAVQKSITDGLAAVREDVQKTLEGVQKDVTGLGKKVDEAAELARKADDAVRGTVIGEAQDDKTGVRKSDTPSAPALLDTAYNRA